MCKVIRRMQIDPLKESFKGVRDMVVLHVVGLDAVTENKMRLDLRKKGIRMQMWEPAFGRQSVRWHGLAGEKRLGEIDDRRLGRQQHRGIGASI